MLRTIVWLHCFRKINKLRAAGRPGTGTSTLRSRPFHPFSGDFHASRDWSEAAGVGRSLEFVRYRFQEPILLLLFLPLGLPRKCPQSGGGNFGKPWRLCPAVEKNASGARSCGEFASASCRASIIGASALRTGGRKLRCSRSSSRSLSQGPEPSDRGNRERQVDRRRLSRTSARGTRFGRHDPLGS